MSVFLLQAILPNADVSLARAGSRHLLTVSGIMGSGATGRYMCYATNNMGSAQRVVQVGFRSKTCPRTRPNCLRGRWRQLQHTPNANDSCSGTLKRKRSVRGYASVFLKGLIGDASYLLRQEICIWVWSCRINYSIATQVTPDDLLLSAETKGDGDVEEDSEETLHERLEKAETILQDFRREIELKIKALQKPSRSETSANSSSSAIELSLFADLERLQLELVRLREVHDQEVRNSWIDCNPTSLSLLGKCDFYVILSLVLVLHRDLGDAVDVVPPCCPRRSSAAVGLRE